MVCFVRTAYNCQHNTSEWAFVQWFEVAAHNEFTGATGLPRLRWSHHSRTVGGGPAARCPWYDLAPLASLIEPVFIQNDPTAEGHFLYNHYVR